jgi:hypothetical protein
MKKYIFREEQIIRLALALNKITVTGMQQAEQLTICKQVLDAPLDVVEEEGEKNEPKA